ncbi:MAG: zinc ABC transporter substrate-binding protein, partial [Lachnospiraceae bacterium]|nr:zinc ABC transporter substrate-binding protein [Lachnospiraceae bacterium]
MKKQLGIFTAMTALTATLCGCGADTAAAAGAEQNTETAQDRLQIVTTIYPEYDWVMNVLGDQAANADVKMLLDNGVDLHSYQPSAQDIVTISDCDVFVYVGGESDNWVKDTLTEVQNTDMVVIDLVDALG